ncbi:MAG TPA: hypothetical protein VML57_08150 [Burkholderiales bacterium]|nr:hypothetical protein [Burkholderiales bacterium]
MAETPAESREALLRYLEELSGRRLASRSDVRAFLQEKEALRPQDLPSVRRWRTAKRATIGALFVFAALQYHLMECSSRSCRCAKPPTSCRSRPRPPPRAADRLV